MIPPRKPFPRVLCRGWDTASGAHIRCLVGYVQAGEPGGEVIPGGQCVTCGAQDKKAQETRRIRNARDVARRAREPHEVREMTDEDWADLQRGK